MNLRSLVKKINDDVYKSFSDNEGLFQQGKFMPVRNFVRSQPVQQAYQTASSVPLAGQFVRKPVEFVQSAARFSDPRTTPNALSPQGLRNYGDAVRQGIDTAAMFYGGAKLATAPLKSAVATIGTNVAAGAGFNSLLAPKGQKTQAAFEGAESGLNFAPYSGALGLTNQAQGIIANKVADKIANPVAQFIARRGASVGTNVAEGIGLNTIQGRNPFDPQGIFVDALAASVLPAGGRANVKVKGAARMGDVYDSDVKYVREVLKKVGDGFKNGDQIDMKGYQEAVRNADIFNDGYNIMPKKEWARVPLQEKYQWISRVMQDRVSSGQGIQMGFADGQSPRVTIQDKKGTRMMVGPKLKVKSGDVSGVGKIGDTPTESKVQSAKQYVNKLYTELLDRYHPLSQAAKGTKHEQAMRHALSQNYGAGSTGTYHVDYELSPILKSADETDLREYVIAQRDIELAGRDIKGSSAEEGRRVLEKLNQKYGGDLSQLSQTADKLYQYQQEMVKKYLVDTGIMSEEGFAAMTQNNQKYVPFKRIMDEMDDFLGAAPQKKNIGSVGSQNVVSKIKGSDRQIVDPLQSIIENTYKMVAIGRRNQVAKTIASLVDEYPDTIKPFTGEVGMRPVISVFENGKVKKYLVPKDVAEAAKGLNEESLNAVIKILSVPTQVLRATATGYNPEFQAPNMMRDLQSAFVNVGLNPLRFVEGMAHLLKQDEVYQDFLKAGGKTSTIMLDRPTLIKKVGAITKPKSHLITHPRDLLEALRTMGELSEQPTRIAVFEKILKQQLKKGIDRDTALKEAAYQAQDATVNFARRGSKTQAANALIAFINARAQGSDKLLRTIKNNPKGGLFRLALISQVPAVALYAWNRTFPEYYDDRFVSEYDKRDNFIFMLPEGMPGGARYLKIPKAEIGKFANPTEAFMAHLDSKGDNKAFQEFLASFTNLLPASSPGELIPTAIRPPIENMSNYSFFTKREIVPEYKKEYPKPYQYTSATPSMYREIGAETDQSPAMLQNLVEGYTTGFGKMAAGAYEAIAPEKLKTKAQYTGAPVNIAPVVRRFAGGEKRTEEEQRLMDERKANNYQFQIKDVKAGMKRGDIPEEEGLQRIKELEDEQVEAEKKLTTMGVGGNRVELPKDSEKPRFEKNPEDPKNILEKISLAARGIGVDPGNTIKAIFTQEEMRKIEGNALILKRQQNLNKLDDENLHIDHKISLGMGGDNSIDNLQVMTVDQKSKKDRLEKSLIRDLQSGKITREEAQRQIKEYTMNNPAGVPLADFNKSKQASLLEKSEINTSTISSVSDDVDKIKERITSEDKSLTNEEIRTYYLRDINLSNSSSRYDKAIAEKDVWKRLGEIERSDKLTDNQKKGVIDGMLKKIGVSRGDFDYYRVASQDTDIKMGAIYDELAAISSRDQLFKYLIENRREVRGTALITDKVLDNLHEDGVLSKEEAKYIKSIKYDKQSGTVKIKQSGSKGKKLTKISFAKVTPATSRTISLKVGNRRGGASRLSGTKVKKPKITPFRLSDKKLKLKDIRI